MFAITHYLFESVLKSCSVKATKIPKNIAPRYISIDAKGSDTLVMSWADGTKSKYHHEWLRNQCPSVIHSSGQRTIYPGDLSSLQMETKSVEYKDGKVQITWKDGHTSDFDSEWLRARAYCDSSDFISGHRKQTRPVGLKASDPIPMVAYQDIVATEEGFVQWLHHQVMDGLCIVEGMPTEPKAVVKLASLISPISHEFLYGQYFDVRSEPKAVNIAYTALNLRLHMDLAYYESIPGFQYLHCLHNDPTIKGGISIFLDVFEAAEFFRQSEPEDFEVLCRVPATFQKIRDETHTPDVERREQRPKSYYASYMEYQRPHFQLDAYGELVTITWAPPFEGVLQVPFEDVQPYYRAYRKFQKLVEESEFAKEYTIRHRLEPGQVACFNNRRVLHGRTAFEGTTEDSVRHLQGTYLNSDEVLSKYLVVKKKVESKDKEKNMKYVSRVGNGTLPHLL